jgi:diaminopimelate decarboxylase
MVSKLKLHEKRLGLFHFRNGELYCEDAKISDIIERVGTPTYIYSFNGILQNFQILHDALAKIDHLICYSVKANSHLAIIKGLIRSGAGVDVVSRGELYRAIQAGVNSRKIVFAGVGKRDDEIIYALRNNILMFNVESIPEMHAINRVAESMDTTARISIRVNPDVDAKTHKYITTGKKETKFGVPLYQVKDFLNELSQLNNLELIGMQCHIGSQILQIEPFLEALEKMIPLIAQVRGKGFDIKYLNLGGGLGIQYDDSDKPVDVSVWAESIISRIKKLDLTLIIEPGRFIVGNNGCFVAKVIYKKQGHNKKFLITDGGMNDLIRPALYNGFHQIWPLKIHDGKSEIIDVVGPICESADFFAKDRELSPIAQGENLAVMSTGAYGFAMSSFYNSRTFPMEIMVSGDHYYVIRERQEIESLIENEKIPPIV